MSRKSLSKQELIKDLKHRVHDIDGIFINNRLV